MDIENLMGVYDRLADSIDELAASASHQCANIRARGASWHLDPFALDFEGWWVMVPQLLDAGLLSKAAGDALQALNDKFSEMTAKRDPALWEVRALDEPDWNEVRRLARDARCRMNEQG